MLEESLVTVILAKKQDKKYYYKHTQILIGKVVTTFPIGIWVCLLIPE